MNSAVKKKLNIDSKKILVICAQQRSGTTVLRESLGTTSSFINYGEILNTHKNISSKEYSLINFTNSSIRRKISMLLPFSKVKQQHLDDFFLKLKCETNKKNLVVDIKYNEWDYFGSTNSLPFLLQYLNETDAHFVHLIRNNKFEQYVSYRLAQKANKWHLRENDPQKHKLAIKISIDCVDCKKFITHSIQTQQKFESLLNLVDNKITILYEDMFDDFYFSSQLTSKLSELIGEKVELPAPKLKKINRSIKEKIENFDEVKSYFEGTLYEEMIP